MYKGQYCQVSAPTKLKINVFPLPTHHSWKSKQSSKIQVMAFLKVWYFVKKKKKNPKNKRLCLFTFFHAGMNLFISPCPISSSKRNDVLHGCEIVVQENWLTQEQQKNSFGSFYLSNTVLKGKFWITLL